MWPAEGSWAGRLTVRSARPLGRTVRMGIRRRIEGLDPHPAMPPTAMLFVRRLSIDASPGPKNRTTLEHGIRDRLARLYDTAARPAAGQADPAAEAVVFPDEATMIACLLADVRRGWAPELWWWQSVWLRGALPRAAGAVLATRPEQVPAVFRVLDGMGEAVQVAALLERKQAVEVARAILTAHAAVDLAEVFEAARRSANLEKVVSAQADPTVPALSQGRSPFQVVPLPLGLPRLPQGAESLPPENRVLLVLALGLASAPQVVRSRQFAAQAYKWMKDEYSVGTAECPRAEGLPEVGIEAEILAVGSDSRRIDPRKLKDAKNTDAPPEQVRGFAQTAEAVAAFARPTSHGAPPAVQASAPESKAKQHREAPVLPAAAEPVPSPVHARQEGLRTNLGGALYLIAAFERLGIPECFEPAWPFSNHLSRWAILQLVTRGLLSAAGQIESDQDDPIWAALSEIDGREPGLWAFQNFPMCDAFRVPQAWASELNSEPEGFAWAARQGRITVWSRAGWILADRRLATVERSEEAARAAIPEHSRAAACSTERLPWSSSPHTRLGAGLRVAPALKFWLECTLPSLRVWLGRAMSLDRPDYGELADSLLRVPGQLFITSTRVDFSAPIDQARISVRRAALDLDPGWLPAWGRSVQFHYGDASGGFR